MAITVGLDFGTHQTKICIENSDTPLHKTYEFYEWEKGIYAFPSIIQVNKDHTLRYGSIDLDSCLVSRKRKQIPCPQNLVLPTKPVRPQIKRPRITELPPEPIAFRKFNNELKELRISELYGVCKHYRSKKEYPEYNKWETACKDILELYKYIHDAWIEIKRICPDYSMPEPPLPPLPEEPFLNEYEYDYNTMLEASFEEKIQYRRWRTTCKKIDNKYSIDKIEYDKAISKYKEKLYLWEKECQALSEKYQKQSMDYKYSLEELPMIFRYFKQATFSSYKWDYEIKASELTVLYLAYVIFRLEERFGRDFSIQMGVPASESTFNKLKAYASGYLIQAIKLVEDVFQNNFKKFLATPYEELLTMIPKYDYSEDLKMQYGLIILPEAYAALRSLTANSRIPRGMSIMLDIGGGTTDISFFVIEDNGEPHIYHFESIAKGLNFFLEYEDRQNVRTIDFSKKKELEDIPNDVFNNAFKEFKGNIDTVIKNLTDFLHQDTISRGFIKSAFRDAVQNRPAIYTGGGCYDNRMRKPIFDFSDVKYIDKKILGIPNVVEENRVTIPYSLMATAFGLSIQRLDDEIEVSKKEDLFAKYTNVNEQYSRWDAHREHGMYED